MRRKRPNTEIESLMADRDSLVEDLRLVTAERDQWRSRYEQMVGLPPSRPEWRTLTEPERSA